jgi:hypothetical protein
LPVEQLFELGVAVPGVVAWRTAAIVFVKLLVGIVDAAAGEIEADLVVLARDLGNQLAVSTISSSPSMNTSFSWSVRITAGSR